MFVITGGGSGIGTALAHNLASRGNDVFIIGRREAPLKETAKNFPLITYKALDISTSKGRDTLVQQLAKTNIKGLVHNAGIIDPICPLAFIEDQAWQKILDTNLNAPFFLTKALLPQLEQGRVLHISSGAAHFPVKSWGGYCVSKAAISMLTRCWQIESEHVAFASVKPGIIDTDMQALIRHSETMDKAKFEFFHNLKKENKLLSTATVAAFLTWLLLDIPHTRFSTQEWDIYDTTLHHDWLKPPHHVPPLE